jgi:hypothetical protein
MVLNGQMRRTIFSYYKQSSPRYCEFEGSSGF